MSSRKKRWSETPRGKANSGNQVAPPASAPRLVSIDVFRGWVMWMMIAHVLGFCAIAEAKPESQAWQWLCFHWSHVEWRGMSLHDLIQPGFSFLVGTALAFSVASRLRRGQGNRGLILHAAWRAVALTLLGVYLRSLNRDQTNWTFEDTLSQIGLGYLPLVLIGIGPKWLTWSSIGILLVGFWTAFATYPLPADNFDYAAVGVPSDWPHLQPGFAAHWNKNSNPTWAFDRWLKNILPQKSTFEFHPGGYGTLSFIPTLATMLLGLVAGRWLQAADKARVTMNRFAWASVICLGVGYALDATGICPSIKRIWTPSWVLVSGGWCFLILGLLHWICDIQGYKRWANFFIVFGMNSIAAYVMDWFMPAYIRKNMATHFGSEWASELVGEIYAPLVSGSVVILVIWLVLWWMHRNRLYIKI